MYTPRQIGIPRAAQGKVVYQEQPPPTYLSDTLYCTWELRTTHPLSEDFLYLVLPDTCTDIILDIKAKTAKNGVFVMASTPDAAQINLGKDFHFVGIRLFPGTFATTQQAINGDATSTWDALKNAASTNRRQALLRRYTKLLLQKGWVAKNLLMRKVLLHSATIHRVSELENLTGYTTRQLRRLFIKQTGFTPRDFLKVLRFQQTLADSNNARYADQSHLIKEYRRITGMTPRIFKSKY